MPRRNKKLVSKPKRPYISNRNRRRNPNSSRGNNSVKMAIHRRLVLFPETTSSKWLSNLSWFAGIALKLFTAITSVTEDLKASEVTVGSGSVIILGPGDFAAHSPYAVPVSTTSEDAEVKCLKSFSFERVALHTINVSIVPSVDLGSRGGMYAALLIPIDSNDFQLNTESENAKTMMMKFSANYDDIIRHPKAKMGPVTKTLNLRLNTKSIPHNVRVKWNSETGFVNAYPNSVLLVAFSDLASTVNNVSAGYEPTKSLFEVHLKGNVSFHEPADLVVQHDKNTASMSNYTPKLLTSNCKSINKISDAPLSRILIHYGKQYEYVEPFSFEQLPYVVAKDIIKLHCPQALDRLEALFKDQNLSHEFEMVTV